MKKTSETIHREHAEQKVKQDRERAGYKGRSQSIGPSKKEENALSNPFAQMLALAIRLNRAKQTSKAYNRKQYKPRKV